MKKRIDWVFWIGIILLGLLLFKNPFSGQNIISDLEPSPDTIHYLSPVKSFLNGQGLKITYEGRQINSDVPPLYSLVLIPSVSVFKDIRSYYFSNLILVFISAFLFYKIASDLIKNKYLKAIIFLSFVTSTIIYWYPQVAMAENLIITLFLFSIWLLLNPVKTRDLILMGLLAAAFYGTKYTALSLSGVFLAFSLIKISKIKLIYQQKLFKAGILLGASLIGFLLLSWIEYSNKGSSALSQTIGHLAGLSSLPNSFAPQLISTSPPTADFSKDYFGNNLITYLFGFVGGEVSVAGKGLSLITTVAGFIGFVGLLINPFFKTDKSQKNENNLVDVYLLIASLTTIFFISFFITNDARYIFIIILSLILSSGILLDRLVIFLNLKKRTIYSHLVISIISLSILSQVFNPILNELKINFQSGEKAANYETVLIFNNYFSTHKFSQKPVVISTLPPYLIDFYSNHSYELLPLSQLQYFTGSPYETWGIQKGVKFLDIYQQKLAQSTPLFISNYRTQGYFYNTDFEKLKSKFNLTKVEDGCNTQCDLYRLSLK